MDEDPAETMRWSVLLSGLRGADAYLARGLVLEYGVGVNRDLPAAAANYRLAAERGHALAQFRLGLLLAAGRGVKKDLSEAVGWLEKAARQGVVEAGEELIRYKAEAQRATAPFTDEGNSSRRSVPPQP